MSMADMSSSPSSSSQGSQRRGIPVRTRSRPGNRNNLLRRTISANSLSGSGSMGESSASALDSGDVMSERLKREDGFNTVRARGSGSFSRLGGPPPLPPPRVPTPEPGNAHDDDDGEEEVVANPSLDRPVDDEGDPFGVLQDSPGRDIGTKPFSAGLPRLSRETTPRRGLKQSGENLLAFFGLGGASKRRLSLGGLSAKPTRQLVGNLLVSRRGGSFVQRALRQDGSRLLINRMHSNYLEFPLELGAIVSIEPRYETAEALHVIAVSTKRELILFSAVTEKETDEFRILLTQWTAYFNQDALCSPRASPRRGNLRGYLHTVKKNGQCGNRVWASQQSGDVLTIYGERAREALFKIDLLQMDQVEFSRPLLELTLVLPHERYVFRCENEDLYVYWKTALLSYCPHLSPPKDVVKSTTIQLNYSGIEGSVPPPPE